jgi:hypothetical protein
MCLILCAALTALPGCSERGAKLDRVSGTVTRGGQPVPEAIVHFVPGAGRPSWGQTDRTGHYELRYVAKRMGAVPGIHRVFVTFREKVASAETPSAQSAEQQAIVQKYGTRELSPLTANVERDGQVINFELD